MHKNHGPAAWFLCLDFVRISFHDNTLGQFLKYSRLSLVLSTRLFPLLYTTISWLFFTAFLVHQSYFFYLGTSIIIFLTVILITLNCSKKHKNTNMTPSPKETCSPRHKHNLKYIFFLLHDHVFPLQF